MPLSQVAVALLYLYACLLGMALGLLYDGCRITRIFLGEHYSRRAVERLHALRLPLIGGYRRHRARRSLCVVVFAEDFLFCLIAGVAFILLCYEAFDGRLRPMALVCMAGGFALYRRCSAAGPGVLEPVAADDQGLLVAGGHYRRLPFPGLLGADLRSYGHHPI